MSQILYGFDVSKDMISGFKCIIKDYKYKENIWKYFGRHARQ